MAISGDYTIVGALWEDAGGSNAGAAYISAIGFLISPVSGNTTEAGGQVTFTVRLTNAPTADVTIAVTSSDTGEGMVDTSSLTFTDLNWNVDQTVTVTGVDDLVAVADGDQGYSIVIGAASSTDTTYNGLDPADVPVTNMDDDTAGFTVTAISDNTTETGGTATFAVKLNSQPDGDVMIDVISSDITEGTVDKASLTFTSLDWNINQTVTVTGVDDSEVDGDQSYTIQLMVNAPGTSDTTGYALLDPPDVAVSNIANDTAIDSEDGGDCFIDTSTYGS